MRVARCQQEDVRATFLIADGMELGVPATFGDADTMSQGPPLWMARPLERFSFIPVHIRTS